MTDHVRIGSEGGSMFTVSVDRPRRRLEIGLEGFWSMETMDRFEREMVQGLRELKQLGGARECLVDASHYPVQSREVSERHQALLAGLGDLAAERIAMVLPGQLVKLQAARAAGDLRHRMFASRDEALAWLDEAP